MSTCHFQALPPIGDSGAEEIRYYCLESPCVDNDVTIVSRAMDAHATKFHNATHISTDMRAAYRNSGATANKSDEAVSPT